MSENLQILMMIMAGTSFFVGLFILLSGVYVLLFRTASAEIQSLTEQTTLLAQKSLGEDMMAGLFGQSSIMIEAINQLVRTVRGIGVLLIFIGVLLIAWSGWLALQIL